MIGSVDGIAAVKNSNGDTRIGEVTGDARLSAAERFDLGGSGARRGSSPTANGDVRLGDVARGAAVAQSAMGTVEVGIHEGVAAWLELDTKFGQVHNDLDASESPGAGEDAVEVHASTSFGDVLVHRSSASREGSDAS